VTPLLVMAGALVGAPLRLLADRIAVARRGRTTGLGTLTVNVAGSAVLGFVLGLAAAPSWAIALIGTGFCGTLTTFSTFGYDVVRLTEEKVPGRALAYLATTLVLGVGAAATGYGLGGLL
jgi:fluoride exporter